MAIRRPVFNLDKSFTDDELRLSAYGGWGVGEKLEGKEEGNGKQR
jgi:hypothetical protein